VIKNPVIPGFHPDPDIIRVGRDYYITTTTFEWYPGIGIHHSTDLVNWELIGYALHEEQIDLTPVPDSGGNYIPSLAHHGGTYYLVYSIVYAGAWPHVANRSYLITAPSITGPWSRPAYLNSTAFDTSVFIDHDGRMYILNLEMETRHGYPCQMRGFALQELSRKESRLVGRPEIIWETDDPHLHPEGPHIYRKDGFYYIMCAIGGTKWEHGTMFLRSRNLKGPYEKDPATPMLSSAEDPHHPLQKAGQGCLVETSEGEWFLAHHASRPLKPDRRCPLGRETCLQRIRWNAKGWPELAHGGHLPALEVPQPKPLPHPAEKAWPVMETFESEVLDLEWNTLREPPREEWISLGRKPGKLCLRGRQPMAAPFAQSMLMRRWTSLNFVAETKVNFDPWHPRQMAGLICYYDTQDFAYACMTHDGDNSICLKFIQRVDGQAWHACPQSQEPQPLATGEAFLRAQVQNAILQFAFKARKNDPWTALSPTLSTLSLSDEGLDGSRMRFTGAFVGLAAHDPVRESSWAEFDHFALYTPSPGFS
jgi:xylan 1,4-beta-xylosidase